MNWMLTLPDPDAVSHAAAKDFPVLRRARGRLYQLLAADPYRSQVDWDSVEFF